MDTKEAENSDLVTVQSFAEKFRVDASVVRGWVKRGLIDYALVGPRNMKRIRRSDLLRPISPDPVEVMSVEATRQQHNRNQLIGYLTVYDGMDLRAATEVVSSMSPDDVAGTILGFLRGDRNGQQPKPGQSGRAGRGSRRDPGRPDADGGS